MTDYKELVDRLRQELDYEAADAIEALLADIECRKNIAQGLVFLNNELSKVSAEKSEQIYRLEQEIKRMENENFWLCRGGRNENLG